MSPAPPITPPLALLGITLPMVLWGAALGAIPIVIHLLHKRKYRETNWAAMRFLLEAARKHSRRIQIEQLLLLAVRTLILLFLVCALRGFWKSSTSAETLATGPTHHILVVDASFSMRHQPAGDCSLFVRAKQAALRIVDSASTGDEFNLVLITGSSDREIVKTPTRSRPDFRNVLGEFDRRIEKEAEVCRKLAETGVQPTQEAGRLLPTLAAVKSALDKSPDVPKRVYVISDFQKSLWRPESQTKREECRKAFQLVAQKASLSLIDVAPSTLENAAVVRFDAKERFAVTGRSVRLTCDVRNFGVAPLAGRKLKLLVDNVERNIRTLDLGARDSLPVEFTYPRRDPKTGEAIDPVLTPGDHTFEVRLDDDALPLDNARRLVLPVRDKLRVLLVNGRPASRPRDEATFYVSHALKPVMSPEEKWDGVIEPKVVTASDLLGTDLSRVDCVFLCSVPTLKENEARKLQAFVESGGGLVVSMGENVDLRNYNAKLYRNGAGVLPAKLTRTMGAEYGIGAIQRLDIGQLNHPIVEPFEGNPGTGLENVLTFRYVRAEPSKAGGARVALRFQRRAAGREGDPAIITSAGRGRLVLITTSLDSRWSSWCLNPSFPALMNEIVYFSVAGRWKDRRCEIGEPIERGFPLFTAVAPSHVAVKTPAGETQSVAMTGTDRWIVVPGGADSFSQPPKSNEKPAGRLPSGAIVRRLDTKDDAVQLRYRNSTVWTRANGVRRLASPMLYFDGTRQAGVYEVKLQPPLGTGSEFYAVNPDAAESDLEKATEPAMRNEMLSQVPFDYFRGWRETVRARQSATMQQSTPARWFLLAVLGLLFVELLMAWRFSIGLLALCGLAAFELTRVVSHQGIAAGIATGVVAFGAIAAATLWQRRRQRLRAAGRKPSSGL